MFVLPLSRVPSRVQLSRVADDTFERFFANAVAPHTTRSPAVDVSETDVAYTVSFDVPGVTREQLKVSIEGRKLTLESVDAPKPVEADAPAQASAADLPRALYRERSAARYARSLSLPAEVDQAASHAKFENGVLTLTLVKKVKTGATQLAIA